MSENRDKKKAKIQAQGTPKFGRLQKEKLVTRDWKGFFRNAGANPEG